MDKIKTVLIGISPLHEEHIQSLKKNKRINVVAVCNIDNKSAKIISGIFSCPFFLDVKSLLENTTPEAALVSVPHDQYGAIVAELLDRNIHILKEKPFSMDLDEALLLMDKVKKSKSKFMVVSQRRFHETFLKAKEYMPTIGRVQSISYQYFFNRKANGWRKLMERAGGGVLLDLGYHIVDVLNWYFGLPLTVFAKSSIAKLNDSHNTEDNAALIFEYPHNAVATILITRAAQSKSEHIKIIGKKGEIDITRSFFQVKYKDGENIMLKVKKDWDLSFERQLDQFVNLIGNRAFKTDKNSLIFNSLVIDAAYLSSKLHQEIKPSNILKYNKFSEKRIVHKKFLRKEKNAYSYN